MANLNDFKNLNTTFSGTEGITVPVGTGNTAYSAGTANNQRPASANLGELRYNTTTGLPEFYTASGWSAVAPPPTITTISGTINADTSATITVNGTNFTSGSVVSINGAATGNVDRPLTTTFVNSAQLTANTNATSVTFVGGASFDVKVTNPSGLGTTLTSAGTIDRDPIWSTSQGTLGTDPDHPAGIEYNTFSSYRLVAMLGGTGSWTPPTGVTSVDVLVVGGGGGGGYQVGGGGGAGGLIYRPGFSVTPGTPISWSVGVGGLGGGYYSNTSQGSSLQATNGGDTIFGTLTAKGGGAGANHDVGSRNGFNQSAYSGVGQAGGSSGGSAGNSNSATPSSASQNQTSQAGDSGTYGFGNNGGSGRAGGSTWAGGGGGGAGGAGANSPSSAIGGTGGAGKDYSSVFGTTYGVSGVFAGGGGGCCSDTSGPAAGGSGGGGYGYGNNGSTSSTLGYKPDNTYGDFGAPNTGGGGGGVRDVYNGSNSYTSAGDGGSGVIVLRYTSANETAQPTRYTLSATDPDGSPTTYSITSGSLPSGYSFNTSTGVISGYPPPASGATTSTFYVDATSNGFSANRSFSIIVSPTADGSTRARAATSAAAIKTLTGTTQNGFYWISVNSTPTLVYCDMVRDGGGWMCAMSINTTDGHMAHWSNDNFWESTTSVTSNTTFSYLRATDDPREWAYRDFKAIRQGNLWANYSGTKLMVMAHNNGSYVGYRSWNLNTAVVSKFSQFWAGGSRVYSNPSSSSNVHYYYRITNGSINSDVASVYSKTPNLYESADLITNANNYNNDLNRLTQVVGSSQPNGPDATAGYRVGDNSGAGFGTYYDKDAGGRPESDAQTWDSSTWTGSGYGHFGTDSLANAANTYLYTNWNGVRYGGGNTTYNWESASGYNYAFSMFIK